MIGEVRNATVKTSAQINLTIKGTQNYTIPVGYTKMDIFCVGAGGSGAFDSKSRHGGGGGGAWSAGNASAGGAGGGGAGGYGSQKGANGGTNTGGGGGGDGSAKTGYSVGGSGIVLIRLK